MSKALEALKKIKEKFEELAGTQAPLYIYDEYKEYHEAFEVVEKELKDYAEVVE